MGDDKQVDLEYPKLDDNPDAITIALLSVRAADDLRVEYDFERDGWSIQQAARFSWDSMEAAEEIGPQWKEVAFVQAWARESCANVNPAREGCGPLCPECSGHVGSTALHWRDPEVSLPPDEYTLVLIYLDEGTFSAMWNGTGKFVTENAAHVDPEDVHMWAPITLPENEGR
ncbi:MAG: hypothetical protein ABEN55_20375 [Bradymonadaceae bacterium]